ncbi:MAG: hypothetical protein HY319_10455 [Armatimonadetes bacterium]|nr:hypothetical protein [Armatimonadota bacterium]
MDPDYHSWCPAVSLEVGLTVISSAPQDAELTRLHQELDKTFVAYDRSGLERMRAVDQLARQLGAGGLAGRLGMKAAPAYRNPHWDLVDADWRRLKKVAWPPELVALSAQGRDAWLAEKRARRQELAARIRALVARRRAYVDEREFGHLTSQMDYAVTRLAGSQGYSPPLSPDEEASYRRVASLARELAETTRSGGQSRQLREEWLGLADQAQRLARGENVEADLLRDNFGLARERLLTSLPQPVWRTWERCWTRWTWIGGAAPGQFGKLFRGGEDVPRGAPNPGPLVRQPESRVSVVDRKSRRRAMVA